MSAQEALVVVAALSVGSVLGVLATSLAQRLAEKGRRHNA